MKRTFRHTLVSWLCLVVFGLSSAVFRGGVVVCEHPDGSSRLELGACDRDELGRCIADCLGDSSECSEDGVPQPCKDTPLKSDGHLARVSPRPVDQVTLVSFVVVAVVASWGDAAVSCGIKAPPVMSERPPDTLSRIRTVVLIV